MGRGDPGNRYERLRRVGVLQRQDFGPVHRASVVVVGCGALGSAVSTLLVRSGVGRLRVVDRDVVERRNLVDQVLFTESDAVSATPKATAAAAALAHVNADSVCEGFVADFGPDNALKLAHGADLLIDGSDNIETKFLLNDVALATQCPLVYGGCAGTEGAVLVVRPGISHCLRCLWPEPDTLPAPSCRTAGAFPAAITITAGLQYAEALKVLLGLERELIGGLTRIDAWDGVLRNVPMPAYEGRAVPCPACQRGERAYLDGKRTTRATPLCGDDTVLLASPNGPVAFERLARRRQGDPTIRVDPMCIQFEVDSCRVLVFSSGKTLIHGAGDPARARQLHAQYVAG